MIKKLLVVLIIFLAANTIPTYARPGGDWSAVDPDTRAWFGQVHRPDLNDGHTSSCCGEGDAYESDFGGVDDDGRTWAQVTNNRGNPLPVGTKLYIPREKIQNTEGNPTGHVIVFASESGAVFCFIPNGGI